MHTFLGTSLHSVSGTCVLISLQSSLGTAVQWGTLMVLGVLTGTLAQTLSVTVSHLGASRGPCPRIKLGSAERLWIRWAPYKGAAPTTAGAAMTWATVSVQTCRNGYNRLQNISAIRGLFFFALVFSNKHYNFNIKICGKCPSSIWYRDLNPRPLVHDFPPITTRPGLPIVWFFLLWIYWNSFLLILYIYFPHFRQLPT